ncbi:MAG: hypothetical protein IPP10_19495 [Candidatus Competibacteraceae bacterium]|nr:hypothetical protein [Candidatus Competibacteraceae bacterium]MBK9953586.1 hypothetical protein [Candidatus Competibacteraceae bacterium]
MNEFKTKIELAGAERDGIVRYTRDPDSGAIDIESVEIVKMVECLRFERKLWDVTDALEPWQLALFRGLIEEADEVEAADQMARDGEWRRAA